MLKLRFLSLVLSLVALLPAFAERAFATVHAFTVTGTVDFLDVPPGFSPAGDEPFEGSETFTLTFEFDDTTAQSSTNGTTVASFAGAISNISFSFDNGSFVTASSEGVLAADNGSNHQWSFSVFGGSPDFSTDLPDPLTMTNDQSGEDEDFGLQAANFVLLDTEAGAYAQTPPELVLPTTGVFETDIIDIVWESFESPGQQVTAVMTATSINSVPIGAPVPFLGTAASALLLLGVGGTGVVFIRRR